MVYRVLFECEEFYKCIYVSDKDDTYRFIFNDKSIPDLRITKGNRYNYYEILILDHLKFHNRINKLNKILK